ncbi:hypothetical protein AM593_00833, partial [Mytilus galloprovincialis]
MMEEQTTVEGSITNQHKPESDAALDRTSLTESTLDRSLPTPQRLECKVDKKALISVLTKPVGDGSPRPSSLDEGR